jgi:hypothetical protein
MMVVENVTSPLAEHAKRILDSHINVGKEKPASYLPIKTVECVIGISIPAYEAMIESTGNQSSVFLSGECCIDSGAVYVYNNIYLGKILKDNLNIIIKNNRPATIEEFIRKIASEWFDDESPIMPIIRKAFGEA